MAPGLIETLPQNGHSEPYIFSKQRKPQSFDPAIHVAYQEPSKIHTLDNLGLPPSPISQTASTEPFPLLTQAAIEAHRRELFSKDVLDNCMFATRPGSVQIRGMAPRHAPFIHQFWTSPEVLKIVSDLAGVDLVPVMDYEICHANVQIGDDGVEGVAKTPVQPPEATPEALEAFNAQSNVGPKKVEGGPVKAIVPWHRDSHPFVCVVMLSDARHMTEGETEMQKGDGSTVKVRSPQIGGAVILQGRQVSHIAIPAGNMPERITIVTSFRPRNPMLLDDSSCMNIRNKSTLTELQYQWTSYRLHLLSERFRIQAEELDARYQKAIEETDEGRRGDCRVQTVDVDALTKWSEEQARYLKRTVHEMRPVTADDWVSKNTIDMQ